MQTCPKQAAVSINRAFLLCIAHGTTDMDLRQSQYPQFVCMAFLLGDGILNCTESLPVSMKNVNKFRNDYSVINAIPSLLRPSSLPRA